MNHVNTENGRPGEYGQVLQRIKQDGVCPFCEKNLATYHPRPIIEQGAHWTLTESAYPYKPSRHHLLLIHREHIHHVNELTVEAWSELLYFIKKVSTERDLAGGSFLLRFGDTTFTGGSVTHLHAHIIQSDPNDPSYKEGKTVSGLAVRIG